MSPDGNSEFDHEFVRYVSKKDETRVKSEFLLC
jgi:hypothetical protein